MKIHNVRLGFANNSSSSHSIVFLPHARDSPSESGADSFGWDAFTLASDDAKRHYLHAILRHSLTPGLGAQHAVIIANELAGVRMTESAAYGIDHQSQWMLPVQWSGSGVDLEFFDAFKEHLMREDVVVLGGNDNIDGRHPCDDQPNSPASLLPRECDNSDLVARRDGAHWTLFSRASGAKIRLSFDDAPTPHKATRPELVDLKITDFCPYGCAYCYQGSTDSGKHAPLESIQRVLDTLATWKVFEVAIGGGEPTLHPQFVEILKYARKLGIVPNFTTRNLAWINEAAADTILACTGGFAFSVDSADDVNRLFVATGRSRSTEHAVAELRSKASVQYVIGSASTEDALRAIVGETEKHSLPLTLLGYKTTKRGLAFGEKPAGKWIDVIREADTRVAIDTVLAEKYYDELIKRGVHEWMVTRKDGAFSMYIDCVEGTMHRSSYAHDAAVPLPTREFYPGSASRVIDADKAVEVFASW